MTPPRLLRAALLCASALRAAAAAGAVTVTVDGAPAVLGAFAFPAAHHRIVLDNGLFSATFDRDDLTYTGWSGVSVSLVSLVVGGVELAHNLNGEAPRDPDREHSFYIDAGGGASRLVCSSVHVLRLGADLAELAFVDNSSTPLQHSHHVVVRAGVAGIYGFDHLTAVAATTISEVRMNARFDRGVLDFAYSDERGVGQQPTYAYLNLMPKLQDETWRVNGSNAPGLPFPESNGGNLPAGYVYTKYNWALYHADNVLFGHFGHGRGAFHVPLSGATGRTSTASYGIGPRHQDLAIHQDALILNYFSPNHFSTTGFALEAGYSRLYGPWLTLFASGDPAGPAAMLSAARAAAQAEINASLTGLEWMQHRLYAPPANRSTVVGFLEIDSGRSFSPFYVVLTPDAHGETDVYRLRESTYWTVCDMNSKFVIPGVPAGENYTMLVFDNGGSLSETFIQTRVAVLPGGGTTNLGALQFKSQDAYNYTIRLWRVGVFDKSGGEFGLGNHSREFGLGNSVPADVTFACDTFNADGSLVAGSLGQDPDTAWPYAQTQPGVFTIQFRGGQLFHGTAQLFVATSMQQGEPPAVALNGVAFSGALPAGYDDPLTRQAVKSAFSQSTRLTIPASAIVVGLNNLTFTMGASGGGTGFDMICLEVDGN